MVTLLRLCAFLSAISGVIALVTFWPDRAPPLSTATLANLRYECAMQRSDAVTSGRPTPACTDLADAELSKAAGALPYVEPIAVFVSGLISALVFAAIAAILDHVAAIRQRLAPAPTPAPSNAAAPPSRFPGQRL